MSRLHRLRRRAGPAAITHDRARNLAATRVDWPLDPTDATWLDAHLASCESCRSIAAAYDANRLALRSLRDHQPEPPRDLWARTAAAIEGESASRGSSRRAAPSRRRSIPLGALSGIAVIVVVIGVSILSGGFLTARPGDTQGNGNPPIAAVPTARAPGATPMAVGAGSVEWLGTSSSGGLAYSSTKIDKVCPTERQPDCEPVNDRDSKQVDLSIRPKSISQSPVQNQAVVVGTDAAGSDSVVVMSLPTPKPTSTPVPPPTPVVTATPSLTPEPTETPMASGSAIASSEPSESASIEPSATPEVTPPASVEPSVEPTPEATPILTPEPTLSANLAIISGVKVVGQSAAYSPDGAWFAFTARPSDGSEGPDIYVWRVGDQLAHVATSDHTSVFASWAGDRLIGSRVAGGTAESFFIDPGSGEQSAIDGSVWRPAVDPAEHWAVTWDGSVTVAQDSKTPVVGEGSLVLRGFTDANGVDTEGKPAAVVAKGPFAEFDVRWDETGSWFAVWVADGNDPSIGRLSLLQLDPVTGEIDRPHGAPRDMPALPGFSIANGRLAWATPPGQGGEGSRVQVVAWTDDSVGAVESGPVENVVVIH